MFKFSANSSNIDFFSQNKNKYEMALKIYVYETKLVFKSRDETAVERNWNSRARKVFWFPPPCNKVVAYEIGKAFFRLLK